MPFLEDKSTATEKSSFCAVNCQNTVRNESVCFRRKSNMASLEWLSPRMWFRFHNDKTDSTNAKRKILENSDSRIWKLCQDTILRLLFLWNSAVESKSNFRCLLWQHSVFCSRCHARKPAFSFCILCKMFDSFLTAVKQPRYSPLFVNLGSTDRCFSHPQLQISSFISCPSLRTKPQKDCSSRKRRNDVKAQRNLFVQRSWWQKMEPRSVKDIRCTISAVLKETSAGAQRCFLLFLVT